MSISMLSETPRWSSPSDVLARIWVLYSLWALVTSRFSAEDLYRAFKIIDLQNLAQGGFTPIHSDVVPFRRLSMIRLIYNSIHETEWIQFFSPCQLEPHALGATCYHLTIIITITKGLLLHCEMREVLVVVCIKFMVGLEFLVFTYYNHMEFTRKVMASVTTANSIIAPYFTYSIRCGERDFRKCAESKAPPLNGFTLLQRSSFFLRR